MNFVSYAQNFEDVLLWRALRDVQNGRYIDIGAQDPVLDSVSLAFYNFGWRGIHVEPTPSYASRLREARPEETVIEAAVTQEPGPIKFYEVIETGLSTGRIDIARQHQAAGLKQRELVVPCVTLERVLEFGSDEVHWMKVDVEGMEADVLRSWGEHPARPWILVIEATYPNTQEATHGEWIDEVLRRGYHEVFYDGLSRYFVHESQSQRAASFHSPANIFDGYAIARHHFSAQALRCAMEQGEEELRQATQSVCALEEQLETARLNESSAVGKLAQSEIELRATIERLWQERETALNELRRKYEGAADYLRRVLQESQAAEAAARVDLTRFQERSSHLETRLNLAGEERARERVQFARELGEYRDALAKADVLLRALRDERRARWLRLGETLGLWRPLPSNRALAGWSPVSLTPAQPGDSAPGPSRAADTHAQNPYIRADSLEELLAWDDADFVRCAYVTVLGRQPDPEGERYYVDRLRSGHPKLELLAQMRFSSEGRSHDPGIAGFDRALKRFRRGRLPVIGWLIARENEFQHAADERQVRRIENAV